MCCVHFSVCDGLGLKLITSVVSRGREPGRRGRVVLRWAPMCELGQVS